MFEPLALSSKELSELFRMGTLRGSAAGIVRLTFPKRCKTQPANAHTNFIIAQIFGKKYTIKRIIPNGQPEGVCIVVYYEIEEGVTES